MLGILSIAPYASAWSNGGYSADPANPDYGTHDWIAQHALAWLPTNEKAYLEANLAAFLYGTELPDNGGAPDGIGDQTLHHVYYRSTGSLQDDASAVRASEEYASAVAYLRASNPLMAAKTAGILSHYVVDIAVFGHVMGASTDWGAEVHHSDYEDCVTNRMTSYTSTVFDPYLAFDGVLERVGAYDGTLRIAVNTTVGDGGATRSAVWMDANYDWTDPVFRDSAGASLNRAVNLLADVLHTLALDAGPPGPDVAPPTITITSPTAAPTWITATPSVSLAGAAYDNVVVTSVTWRNAATGASGPAEGTTSWRATVGLVPGPNAITVTARDAAGNEGTDTIGVTYDATPPAVVILSPLEGGVLLSDSVTITGTASDNVEVRRVQVSADGVTWVDCAGTTEWSGVVAVGPGTTRLYARATDTAGNTNTTSIRVTVEAPATPASSADALPYALAAVGVILVTLFAAVVLLRRREP